MKKPADSQPPIEVSAHASSVGGPPTSTIGGSLPPKPWSPRVKNLTGQRFGSLLVRTRAPSPQLGVVYWVCRCDCGSEVVVRSASLRGGTTKSCGCLRSRLLQERGTNLMGRRFGRLLVVKKANYRLGRGVRWLCRCDCGRTTAVTSGNLSSGHTISCGCAKKDTGLRLTRNLIGQKFGRLLVVSACGWTKWRNRVWNCVCDCGRHVKVASGHLISKNTTSCGCYSLQLKRELNINPNLTDEDRIRHRNRPQNGEEYHHALQHVVLAQSIFKRDDYKCVACGSRGVKLAAHHILPWAQCKELRYAPANLVTLCKECHDQLHLLYGWDCDLGDLEEFLKP